MELEARGGSRGRRWFAAAATQLRSKMGTTVDREMHGLRAGAVGETLSDALSVKHVHSGQPGARREKEARKEKKQERDAARASQDVVCKVRPVRRFTSVLARTLQALQDTCSKGLVHGRNAVHRAAAAAVAIVRGRGEEEAGSAAQQLQAGSPLQRLAEPPSVPLPLLLPVEPRKVAIRTSCSARLFSSVEAAGTRHKLKVHGDVSRRVPSSQRAPKQIISGFYFLFLSYGSPCLSDQPPPKK